MVNSVVLVGRIANELEMKYLPSGAPVAKFRLAVARGVKSENGQRQTDWLDVVCYQKTAELVSEYCDKGMLVGVEGRIQSRSWEGAGGKRQYAVEIVVNNVRFLESRVESERRRAEAAKRAASGPGEGEGPVEDQGSAGDEDDPFGSEGD